MTGLLRIMIKVIWKFQETIKIFQVSVILLNSSLSFIVSVVYINGKYFMQNDKGYTWRVIKSPKRYQGIKWKPEKLGRGDIIKLGRYIFEVKEISSKSVNKDKDVR